MVHLKPSTLWPSAKSVIGSLNSPHLPMLPLLPVALLACSRIGAVANVVFGGFSASALAARILDCGSSIVVTADSVMRGAKPILLKAIGILLRRGWA